MTNKQEMKMRLLKEFANVNEPKTIETCRRMYEFLAEDEKEPADKQVLSDGVYFIADGPYFTADSEIVSAEYDAPENTGGILLVQGSKRIVIALKDSPAGDTETTLTTRQDPDDCKGNYIEAYMYAVADWNGQENTEHLKKVGLNPKIILEDSQYIPSMGEMYFIFTHRKEVNEALEKAGGEPILGDWYWTSTEYSATGAWSLGLNDGAMTGNTKAAYQGRVRPVSAFIS